MEEEIHQVHLDEGVEDSPREYRKFAGVIGGILIVSMVLGWARGWELERFLSDFMAVFFMTFATFKFVNMENFVSAYRSYDIIAGHLPLWAYAYPFIEGVLGVSYLLLDNSNLLNVVTLILMGIGAVGVRKELTNKSNIMCACLGNVIKLPLSKVSLIENAAMLVMAGLMLLI